MGEQEKLHVLLSITPHGLHHLLNYHRPAPSTQSMEKMSSMKWSLVPERLGTSADLTDQKTSYHLLELSQLSMCTFEMEEPWVGLAEVISGHHTLCAGATSIVV